MEKVQEQLEIFKRVIGEAQDASQDDYAFELLPISKTLESAADSTLFLYFNPITQPQCSRHVLRRPI